jgi:hypothetical protein
MPIVILAGGSPEYSGHIRQLSEKLAYAMGERFVLETAELNIPGTLVLNVRAIAPERGFIPEGTNHKRSTAEFWSSCNIDYAAYSTGRIEQQVDALKAALVAAMNQARPAWVSPELRRRFETAISEGAQQLLSELGQKSR